MKGAERTWTLITRCVLVAPQMHPHVHGYRFVLNVDQAELEKRESELKERALRNKVVRTRKSSAPIVSSGSGSGN